MKTLQERLAFARKERGFTQGSLAEAVRVSRGVITNIEYGKAEPSPIVSAALCRVLEINEDWLLHGTGSMEPDNTTSKMLKKLYEVCKNFSPAELQFMIDMAESLQRNRVIEKPHSPESKTRGVDDIIRNVENRKTASPVHNKDQEHEL